ncbi:arylsulfotransferase family protein [Pseudooceanicola sp. LIPI14-2-Ac024]|uniref:arylsulfotransferase family protein n=1 Tax=Pseudooceanicola sp. LIPI14-2-Ac024 TaxID=3344875 RepID=UPI0035D0EE85
MFSRYVFFLSLAIVGFVAAFMLGAFAYRGNHFPIPQIKMAQETLKENFDPAEDPTFKHLQPARGQGSGVTRNTVPDADSLVMMAGFFDGENQVRIVRRDGSLVWKWSMDYFDHFPDLANRVCDVASPLRVDTHGAHVTPQGEVLVNYEYCGTVKVDQCSDVIWRIESPTHHSLVPAEAGGYWILGRKKWAAREAPDRFPPFSTPANDDLILEDTLMRISEDGEVLDEISIPIVLLENDLMAPVTSGRVEFLKFRPGRTELLHANQATELPSALADAFPLFEAGDIAISIRDLNFVFVMDPDTHEVKWHQTGPWLRQHDAEFRTDGRLSMFNNNTYRNAYRNERTNLKYPFTTNIIAIDPVSGETEVLFGERPGEEMLSVIRGQHENLDGNGLLITEFDAGRVLEVDGAGEVVWEYVNAYDDKNVGEIRNAVVLPGDYFETELGPCTSD